ncbi:hypothetical protein [Planosporangium mesophilum]|uniref:Uncharacterized protein n=1 Tax=Planosporangium mesophilum TaxID=689768 RepID=A0A8J3T8J9_9ACTN|nr:hypothetical protein [Planosporangium mesophilum]NJC83379.1 hypothetical protein [Planosporangium mesophilum]GII21758.1 hypothetical protein Pme01_13550 [Planosporangium mesophilum]
MGELADRIHAMQVRASTPDGRVTTALRHRSEVTLAFAPGWYDRCDERDLERRLAALASLLWVARTREYWRTVSDVTGDDATHEEKPVSPRDVKFAEAREALVARGSSADGRVCLSVEGMRRWTVRVAPGTVRALDEHEFGSAVGQAAAELIEDQFSKIARLKYKIYEGPEG